MKKLVLSLVLAFGVLAASASTAAAAKLDPQNTLYINLKYGRVVIQMLPDVAPKTVARIKTLTRQGFYNGLKWHRVIAGFMAQTGDPTGTGMGGSSLPNVPAEFSSLPFTRGAVGMARAQDINSGNSQFFIMLDDTPSLNGQYTLWGKVVSGMQYVDQIKKGDADDNGTVTDPDTIVSMQIAADADKTPAKKK
ncbi:MAG: peptidylprolyl isomerase [Alphaproteobacteria bacterium]|nr:peptidylprolyl isomerase [Alphaproteobacteria bacterium]MDE2337595.1 peptidylprolyl isomerase [Alphaproteobacteria bacterium]